MSGEHTTITVQENLGHINLRGDPRNADLVTAVESVLQQALPATPNTVNEGTVNIYWLGPDEFNIVCDASEGSRLTSRLGDMLARTHSAVNDLTGGLIAIRLFGSEVATLLSKGCALDLDSEVFLPGMCAQSGLAKTSVVLGRLSTPECYEILVRRSFSRYLLQWLRHAAST